MRIYVEVNGKSVTEARKEIQSTLANMGIDVDFGSMPDGDEVLPVSVEIPDFEFPENVVETQRNVHTADAPDPYNKEETIRKIKDWLSEKNDQYVNPDFQAAIKEWGGVTNEEVVDNHLETVHAQSDEETMEDFDSVYYIDYEVDGRPFTVTVHVENSNEAKKHFDAIKENGEIYGRID